MATIDEALAKLQKSTFRAKFHLTEKDRQYVKDKGMDTVREHGRCFCEAAACSGSYSERRQANPDARTPCFRSATRVRLLLPEMSEQMVQSPY